MINKNSGSNQPTQNVQESLERGVQHHSAGRLPEAENIYRQILIDEPTQPVALHLLGVIAHQRGKHDTAVDLITKALAVKPDYADAHNNLGLALKELGELDEAVASYHEALKIKPDAAELHNNLGLVYAELRRRDEAVACYHRALTIWPDFAEAHCNLGITLREQGKLGDAVASYHKSLTINSGLAKAHNNLGSTFKDLAKIDEAVASYRRALTIKPGYTEAHSNLLLSLNYETDITQTDIIEESREWDRRHASAFAEPPNFDNSRLPNRRLRVGYVSPDLRRHSVSYFFEPLIAAHDPTIVETYCYADVAAPDSTTSRLEGYAGHWRKTVGMGDLELAEMIRTDCIDILVDLAGHTARNRLSVFARRPAPIQVSWLGYPNTTGLETMDYRLADAITDPGNEVTETLVRLPNGFLCYLPDECAPPLVASRGVSSMTFGSFNNATKLSKSCIELWARILSEVPESRLLLNSTQLSDAMAQEVVRDKFSNTPSIPRGSIYGDVWWLPMTTSACTKK